jgi:predicted ATPase/DNA-binding SARP family transcriptional activator
VINHVDRRTLELRLLGPMEAWVDGVSVSVSGPRRRALLIRLALSANEVVSKDRLIDDLWGEDPPPTAAKSLHVQVSQLRDALRMAGGVSAKDDELLVTRQSGYMLKLEPDSVDVSRFEQSCAAAREALEQHSHARAGAICRAALSLWRGPALDDVSQESFAVAEIARLEELRLGVIEMRIEADLAQSGHVEIISELETLVARHPLREHLWWLLALALYRSGRQAEAVRACTRLRQILREELGLDPSLEITTLEHRIIVQDPALERRAPGTDDSVDMNLSVASQPRAVLGYRTNLPRIPTPFIGGERLLEEIAEQLRSSNVVTLTGTGGVGKTRAAIEFGHRHAAEFDGGVFFVDLAPVSNTGAVIDAVASTLPLVALGEQSLIDTVVDWIGDRRVLLVMDNCEHLVGEVAVLVEELIGRCWNMQILATSREALRVPNEHVYCVPSLAADGPAVELFCERARAIDPSFSVDGHLDALTLICERLDGIPLAIELAAARARSLSVEELLERLRDRFRVLRGSGRSTLDRHHTLRATVSWSYQLLSADERLLFDRASVFAGGFDLRAAEMVCGFDPIDDDDVVDLVSSLVDKSMIVADRGAVGMRYRLLETLRQYGEDQLELRGETARMRDRHAAYYADLIAELDLLVRGARQIEGEARMAIEWDNLRAAHLWSLADGDLDLAERLIEASFHYSVFSMRHEHAAMLERTVQLGDERDRPSTNMLGMLSYWVDLQGDQDESRRLARRGIELAASPDDPATAMCWFAFAGASVGVVAGSGEALTAFQHQAAAVADTPDLELNWWALVCLTDASLNTDLTAMSRLRQQMSEMAVRVQSPRLSMFVHQYGGHACLRASPPNFAAALTSYERVVEIAHATGDRHSYAIALRCLAMASTGLGAPDALTHCHDALAAAYEIRVWPKVWQTLESVTLALASDGRTEEAAVILGHLDAHSPGFGLEHGLLFRDQARELVEADGGYDAAKLSGALMPADELVATALVYCSANTSTSSYQ